ncbi:MAG: hypothetical protein V2A61_08165 [Calditrichota bacterium]
MNITDINSAGGLGPLTGSPSSKPTPSPEGQRSKSVEASRLPVDRTELDSNSRQDARVLEAAKMVIEALPEIRSDRVALARQRLSQGYYDRPEIQQAIAAKLVQDPESRPIPTLSSAQTDEMRNKIQQGYYLTDAVMDIVTNGLLEEVKEK